jgi:hypothetical protein
MFKLPVSHLDAGRHPRLLAILFTIMGPALFAAEAPLLEFIQPTNGAVFSTLDEIPVVLRGFSPDDVIAQADVLANQEKIATVNYCCWLCPCAVPMDGMETILQIPVPREIRIPPWRTWQGWTNVGAGSYRLTARGVSEHGNVVEAVPVNILVLDLTLQIHVGTDGVVVLSIRQGSLVGGHYELEASPDLHSWENLGSFEPGDVAAFFWDVPPVTARARRFYRSVYIAKEIP